MPPEFRVHLIGRLGTQASDCGSPPEQPNVLSCRVFDSFLRSGQIVFTTDEPPVQRATLAPGGTVAFTLPLRVPVQGAAERRVEVVSRASPRPLDLEWDGATLTLAAPEGFAVYVLSSSPPVHCPTGDERPDLLTCALTGLPAVKLTVTTVAFDPDRLVGAEVTYPPGWNLVGVPTGTFLTEPCVSDFPALQPPCPPVPPNAPRTISVVYTWDTDGTAYQPVQPGGTDRLLEGGTGYWVYFHETAPNTLPATSPQTVTRPLPAGRFVLIGNPGTTPTTVSGADAVYVYDPALAPASADPAAPPPPPCAAPAPGCAPAAGYRPATTLLPGQGAWAISFTGGEAVISTAEP